MINDDALNGLPSYRKPPVDEVAIAFQFAEVSPFATLYGAFYDKVKDRLPSIEEHDPIIAKFETFSGGSENSESLAELLERIPPRRVWFLAPDQHRLIQIQPDRIVQNWRKMRGEGVYPRFGTVLSDFLINFRTLQEIVQLAGQEISINQCEVTYFNNIELLDEENYSSAFNRVFSWPLLDRVQPSLNLHDLEPERTSFNLGFRVLAKQNGEPRARLAITAQPAMLADTGARVIRLTLVFRGPPPTSDDINLQDFLLLGREAIVRTFTDITSKACHEIWERER